MRTRDFVFTVGGDRVHRSASRQQRSAAPALLCRPLSILRCLSCFQALRELVSTCAARLGEISILLLFKNRRC